MDTQLQIMPDPTHVYSNKDAMDFLKKIFDQPTLEFRDILSEKGVRLVGIVDVDIKHQKHYWSEGLYKYLGLNPDGVEADHELFLSYVIKEDRQELRARILEDFDGQGRDPYFLFRIQTAEDGVANVLGLRELTTNHKGKPELLRVKIFDVSKIVGSIPPRENLDDHLSSKWLNRVFENKVAGIFILDKKGQFLRSNQTCQKITEYTSGELKHLNFLDVSPTEEWDICREQMAKLVSGELEFLNFERQLLTKSGNLRWVEMNCSVIDEEAFYVLCFLTDIHDKKIVQQKFLAGEEKLYEAQKIAKIGSWEMDLRTMKITWSKGMYDLMGAPYDFEPDPQSILQFIHSEDVQLFQTKLGSLVKLKDLEIRHVAKNGVRYVLINSQLEVDDEGIPIRYHGTSQDITERRFDEKRYDLVQNIAKLGWWEADLTSEETDNVWSDSMFELLGLDKSTTRPCFESFLTTLHPEDRELVLNATQDPEYLKNGWYNKETRHKGRDGSYRHFLSSGRYIWDNNRPVKLIGTIMDISETKAMQTKIEEVQEITRLGWWDVDLLTGKTDWSSAIFDILGLDPNKGPLPFEKFAELVHPEDRFFLYQDLRTLKNGWKNVQLRYKRKSGGYTHTIGSGKVIFDGDKPIKLIGTNMDVTSLKETQIKLEAAQKLAKVGWWEFDMTGQGNNLYSVEYMEIFEIKDASEMSSFDTFYSVVHPDDLEFMKENFEKSLTSKGWSNLVNRIVTKSGKVKFITSNATIEFDDAGPTRLFGSVYDITNLKEAEIKLGENLVNLEAMVKSMDSLVLIVDDQLVYREAFCNDHNRIGLDPKELLGRRVEEIMENYKETLEDSGYNKAALLTMYQSALAGKAVEPITFKYSFTGQPGWLESSFKPFESNDGKKWLAVVVNDVTSRRNAEEEMIKSVQKEKELSEMRSQFVSMASHQFRTPLTVIKANMELLELSNIKSPVISKVTQRLNTEVDRLVDLMEDIMAMGKVQSNAVEPDFRMVNLRTLLEKIKLEVERQQKDGRSLNISISGKERSIKLDERFIEHALHNLIENAFKYSPDAPNPEVQIEFGAEKAHISIKDFGIGIPKQDQSRLFTSFQRGSNTHHIQGTGLGLAVAKEFVRLNQGTIYLNDQREKGTEFCIDLPIKS